MHRRLGLAVLFFSSAAAANSFGSLDEEAVGTGELRFVTPKEGRGLGFPLEKTTLSGTITAGVAELKLEQRFSNSYDEAIEAVYVFPLGARAAVHDYEFVIGDHRVRGKIDTKAKARSTYEAARDRGQTAGLVEQERPNLFVQHLANIPPGQTVTVRLSIAELLEPEDGAFEFVFPMVVGPRYQPKASPALPWSPRTTAAGPTVDIDLLVDTTVPTTSLSSPSHAIATKTLDRFRSSVTVKNARPDADFVLRFSGAAAKTGAGLVTHRLGDDGYFMLLLQPKASPRANELSPREVVFIIDTSCSMDGEPLAQTKLVAEAILGTLAPTDTFSLITFADGSSRLSPTPLPASKSNLERARRWLSALSASGGTELASGITAGLEAHPTEGLRAIYLMTDGFVSNDDEIITLVRRTAGFNRLYPVGIGSAPNRALLGSLGEVGRGFTRYVSSSTEARAVADELVDKSTQPYLTDISIDWKGLDVSQLEPPVVPDLHAGQPLLIAGRYHSPGRELITISGTLSGKRVSLPMEVVLDERSDRPALATLWARRRIARLELDDERGEQEGAITDLGLGHHLLTKYTSFVAVDERTAPLLARAPRRVDQPLLVPRGMTMPVESEPPSSGPPSSGRGFGGGGGDLDPFTIATLASFGPLAWALRKRRAARREQSP